MVIEHNATDFKEVIPLAPFNINDTTSILDLLRKEVPMQIEMAALLIATSPDENEKRSNLEKAIAHFEKKLKENPDNTQHQDTLERLRKELEQGTYKTSTNDSELSFSKESLKNRLNVIFGAYLALLEKNDPEGFKTASDIIEKAISDRRKILARVKNSLGKKKETAQQSSPTDKAIAKRAHDFFAPVDKISQSLFNPHKTNVFYDNPSVIIEVGKKGGKPVQTFVSINVNELQGVTLSNGVMVNPFNRSIHNIAISLYIAGNTHITPRMIYQAITGNKRGDKVPAGIYDDIMESMRKLMRTFIKIDASEEAKKFGLDKLTFEGYLMPVKLVSAQINGQEIECFKFLDEPPLYTYASRKKQINRCDIGLLAADVSMSQDNIVIRDYLLEQILTMQNKKSHRNNVILYDTLYAHLGIDAPTEATLRAKKRDVRDKVKAVLDAWVKEGLITGYGEDIEGRKIKGLYIKYAK